MNRQELAGRTGTNIMFMLTAAAIVALAMNYFWVVVGLAVLILVVAIVASIAMTPTAPRDFTIDTHIDVEG